MKKLITSSILLLAVCLLLSLSGCFGSADIQLEQQVDPDMDISLKTDMRYVGMWNRLNTFVNGEAMDNGVAVLEFKKDWFDSYTVLCSASGGVEAEGNALTMKYVASDCPGFAGLHIRNFGRWEYDDFYGLLRGIFD